MPKEVNSTPVTVKSDSKLALNADGERDRAHVYREHCQMAEGMWLGPVPGDGFLEECVPDDDPTRAPEALEALAREKFADVPTKGGEKAFVRESFPLLNASDDTGTVRRH